MVLKITVFGDTKKMSVRIGLALCVMLAMAVGGGSKKIRWSICEVWSKRFNELLA